MPGRHHRGDGKLLLLARSPFGVRSADRPIVVLVHSPLVGPGTWAPVSEELDRRGITAVVPNLLDNGRPPYWSQHAAAVVDALATVAPNKAVVLAGHSGAGPILPAIAAELRQPVAGYVFVDAGLPGDGRSRLEMMESESPDLARELREHLAAGGRFPDWTDADMAPLVPDVRQRTAFVNDLRPRGLDFFTEPIQVPAQWQGDSRCGYLQLSSAYDRPARDAESQTWQVSRLAGDNHFLMLEDCVAVTTGLQDLIGRLGEPGLARGRQ